MSPGVAAKKKVLTLDRPVAVSQTMVRLAGRVPDARKRVTLQRVVNGRWVTVARPRVDGRRYSTRVRTSTDPQWYRTVAGRLRSPVRAVPARSAPPVQPGPGPVADACGAPRFRANGERRTCTFADDFDGAVLDRTAWVPQTIFVSGDPLGDYACYRDHPDNVSVSDGALRLTVRDEGAPVPCAHSGTAPSRYTAGMVSTYRLFSQRYGRFEARIKAEAAIGPGLQEAFWLWPDDRQTIPVLWPAAGEIDIVETYSGNPNLAIPFLHYTSNDNGGPIPGVNTAWDCRAARGVWNTYTLEWTPSRLEILVNGRTCLVNTSGDPAFQWKYIIALTAALGMSTNALVASTPIPATMSVDYVRVWE